VDVSNWTSRSLLIPRHRVRVSGLVWSYKTRWVRARACHAQYKYLPQSSSPRKSPWHTLKINKLSALRRSVQTRACSAFHAGPRSTTMDNIVHVA
jgi:hypothetical protein